VRAICNEVEALVKKCGKQKRIDAIKLPPPKLYKRVEVYTLCYPISSFVGLMIKKLIKVSPFHEFLY
jgi:hypothetical protein